MEDTRNYIRVNEIEKLTSLTVEQVMDAVERDGNGLHAFISEKSLGMLDKTGKVLLGLFNYQGMVLLGHKATKKLLIEQEPINVNRFVVVEPEQVSQIWDCRNHFKDSRLGCFDSIEHFHGKPTKIFYACAPVTEVSDHMAAMTEIGSQSQEEMKQNYSNPFNILSDILSTKQTKLGTGFIGLKPHDLRLNKDWLSQMFGIEAISPNGLVNGLDSASLRLGSHKTNGLKPKIESHPIKQIILCVLKSFPNAKPIDIWNTIKADYQLEVNRSYDKEAVISNMTSDTLFYFGKDKEVEKQLTYLHFRKNLVYTVKKTLKETSA